MTHQCVSFGEHACYRHELDADMPSKPRGKKIRYKHGTIWRLIGALIVTITGELLWQYATSRQLSNIGLGLFVVAGAGFVGFFANPLLNSLRHRLRRRRVRIVKNS